MSGMNTDVGSGMTDRSVTKTLEAAPTPKGISFNKIKMTATTVPKIDAEVTGKVYTPTTKLDKAPTTKLDKAIIKPIKVDPQAKKSVTTLPP